MKPILTLLALIILFPLTAQFQNQTLVSDGVVEFTDIDFADFDNDDDLDLLYMARNGFSKIYRNDVGFFTYIPTNLETFNDEYSNSEANVGDYNNDGKPDIMIVSFQDNDHVLYENKGDFIFEIDTTTLMSKLKKQFYPSHEAGWIDFDKDGDLDYYLSHGSRYSRCEQGIYEGYQDILFINEGDQIFTEFPDETLASIYPATTDYDWIDYNQDGFLDLIIIDLCEIIVLRNDSNESLIKEGGVFAGTTRYDDPSKGVWADYNNDGYVDLFVTGAGVLYKNNGDGTFSVDNQEFPRYSQSALWMDYDNDADMDLLLTYFDKKIQLYTNSNGIFSASDVNSDFIKYGTSLKSFDVDNNGFLDFMVSQVRKADGQLKYMVNTTNNGNHWIKLKLQSTHPNFLSDDIHITVQTTGGNQYQTNQNSIGTLGNRQSLFHFGLGGQTTISSIDIIWPSGVNQTLEDVSVDQIVEIQEPFSTLPSIPGNLTIETLSHREIILNWEDSDVEAEYILQRKVEGESDYSSTKVISRNSKTYKDEYLKHETTYNYRLFARNIAGSSDTLYVNSTTHSPPPPPISPGTLSTISITYYDVVLNWIDNSNDETQFYIERSLDGIEFISIDSVLSNTTEYRDSLIQSNTTYYYRIIAENEGSLSDPSNTLEVLTEFVPFTELDKHDFRPGSSPQIRFSQVVPGGNLELMVVSGYDAERQTIISTVELDENGFGNIDNDTLPIRAPMPADLQLYDLQKQERPGVLYTRSDHAGQPKLTNIVLNDNSWINLTDSLDFEIVVKSAKLRLEDIYHNGNISILFPNYEDHVVFFNRDLSTNEVVLIEDRYYGSSNWIDLDQDGFDEIMSIYLDQSEDVWTNTFFTHDTLTSFGSQNLNFHSRSAGDLVPIDFNYDGNEDLLVIGDDNTSYLEDNTVLYKSNGNNDFELLQSFPGCHSAKWADLNNDGYFDLILEGIPTGFYQWGKTQVYYYNPSLELFEDGGLKIFDSPYYGMVEVGDFDFDGDVDIATTAFDNYFNSENDLRVFKNNYIEETGSTNQSPSVPINLQENIEGSNVLLSWNESSDDFTPISGIQYNLVVRSEGELIIAPMTNTETGRPYASYQSNVGMNTTYEIQCLSDGTYEWAVQSMDATSLYSGFSNWNSFTLSGNKPKTPSGQKLKVLSESEITISWESNTENVSGHVLQRKLATESTFTTIAHLAPEVVSYTDSLLLSETTYHYRVKSLNCANESEFSDQIGGTTYPFHFKAKTSFVIAGAEGKLVDLGDYNDDGYLDLLINYSDLITHNMKVELYTNNKGQFIPSGNNFDAIELSELEWIDYNNDGLLDIFMFASNYLSQSMLVYINRGDDGFEKIELDSLLQNFKSIHNPSWVDLGLDGYPDLVFGTDDIFGGSSGLYALQRTDDFSFDSTLLFQNVTLISDPIDINNDGYYDFPIINNELDNNNMGYIMNSRNKSFGYVSMNTGLRDFSKTLVFTSIDDDPYLDAVLIGPYYQQGQYGQSLIFKNNKGTSFSNQVQANLLQSNQHDASIATGDFYNDGTTDLITMGYFELSPTRVTDQTILYHNLGNFTMESKIGLFEENVQYGKVATGDIDNDGDLDLIHLGQMDFGEKRIVLYDNKISDGWLVPNSPPSPPSTLDQVVSGNTVELSWNTGTDDHTSSNSLSYNILLVKEGDTIIHPLSQKSGQRKIAGLGNAQLNKFFKLANLQLGTYSWAVQSIDGGFVGSSFSEPNTFTVTEITPILGAQQNALFMIYPNPTEGSITIDHSAEIESVLILNLAGKVLSEIEIVKDSKQKATFQVADLVSGTYLLQFKTKGGSISETQKFIKH